MSVDKPFESKFLMVPFIVFLDLPLPLTIMLTSIYSSYFYRSFPQKKKKRDPTFKYLRKDRLSIKEVGIVVKFQRNEAINSYDFSLKE